MRKDLWTEEEIRILKEQYPTLGTNVPINRPKSSIINHASRLGLCVRQRGKNAIKNRLGEERIMTNGQKARIIRYGNAIDIDIEFEDGTIVYNKQYSSFVNGTVSNPNKKCIAKISHSVKYVGMKKRMNCGQFAEIIKIYEDEKPNIYIDVRFEDGMIVKHKTWSAFRIGSIANPNVPKNQYHKHEKPGQAKEIACNGVTYPSLKAFAKNFGLSSSMVCRNLKNGKTPEEIVKMSEPEHCFDHLGNEYENEKIMAEKYDIPYSTYYARVHVRHWDIKRALTTPIGELKRTKILTEQRVGKIHRVANGLHIMIDEIDPKSSKLYKGHFVEDPNVKVSGEYKTLLAGQIDHSHLHRRKRGTEFYGFNTKFSTENGGEVYYECECQICGYKGIMTPYQMIEHAKTHEFQKDGIGKLE